MIFFAILAAFSALTVLVSRYVFHRYSRPFELTAQGTLLGEARAFAIVFVASWIVGRIERRKVADFGLPWRLAFGYRFWQGLLLGFASITLLLGAMRATGVLQFGSLTLHGMGIWEYAILWALAFLFVGLFEEFLFRGYVLFTLTTGTGFWPAAFFCSFLFGYVHHSNSGETWVGAFAAGMVGLIFCLLVRRTGDLWMAIGFHVSWDWGETYFYGVPDSGQMATGHLLSVSLSGPSWLTGGTVGPEGSWLCILLLVLLWFFFSVWLQTVEYPDPAALAKACDSDPPNGTLGLPEAPGNRIL